jgi:hypothetical protein
MQFYTTGYEWSKVEKKMVQIKIPITARRQAEIEAWADDQWGNM